MCMAQEGAAAVDDSMSDEETAEEAAAAAASEEEAPAADQPPGQLAPGTKVSLDGDDGSSRPLTVVRTLGRGGYATVYDVEDEDGNHWALKVARGCDGYKGDIKKRDLFAAAVQQSLTNEAILLQVRGKGHWRGDGRGWGPKSSMQHAPTPVAQATEWYWRVVIKVGTSWMASKLHTSCAHQAASKLQAYCVWSRTLLGVTDTAKAIASN